MRSQPSQIPADNLHFRDSHSHWVLTPGRQGAPILGRCLPLPHDVSLSCWKGHFPHHVHSPSRDTWAGWNFPHGAAHQLPGLSNAFLLMYYAALLNNKNLCCNLCCKTQTPLLIDVEAVYYRVFLLIYIFTLFLKKKQQTMTWQLCTVVDVKRTWFSSTIQILKSCAMPASWLVCQATARIFFTLFYFFASVF